MNVRWRSQFKKDYRLMMKQGKNIAALDYVIEELAVPNPLPESYQDHPLKGDYKGYRDCHIDPDWILIYGYDVLYPLRRARKRDSSCISGQKGISRLRLHQNWWDCC